MPPIVAEAATSAVPRACTGTAGAGVIRLRARVRFSRTAICAASRAAPDAARVPSAACLGNVAAAIRGRVGSVGAAGVVADVIHRVMVVAFRVRVGIFILVLDSVRRPSPVAVVARHGGHESIRWPSVHCNVQCATIAGGKSDRR